MARFLKDIKVDGLVSFFGHTFHAKAGSQVYTVVEEDGEKFLIYSHGLSEIVIGKIETLMAQDACEVTL